MIQTTNNAQKFFEDEDTPIYIYGAGNVGQWVARFMRKCNMDFVAFIDMEAQRDTFAMGKKMIHPKHLQLLLGSNPARVVIAITEPYKIIGDLHYYAEQCSLLCLFPVYKDIFNKPVCHNNRMLAYFRQKLVKAEIPTILCNTCIEGHIYTALGEPMLSPTVNAYICPQDFLKLCQAPEKYFSEDMVFDHWRVMAGKTVPAGRVKDIEALFMYSTNVDDSLTFWNRMREWIQWNNLAYIFQEIDGVTYEIGRDFCALPQKHLMVMKGNTYQTTEWNNVLYVRHNHFHQMNDVYENWFDVVGWINGDF